MFGFVLELKVGYCKDQQCQGYNGGVDEFEVVVFDVKWAFNDRIIVQGFQLVGVVGGYLQDFVCGVIYLYFGMMFFKVYFDYIFFGLQVYVVNCSVCLWVCYF